MRVSRKSDVKAPGKNLVRILQMWMVFVGIVLGLLIVTNVDMPSDVHWPWSSTEEDVPEEPPVEPPPGPPSGLYTLDLATDTDLDGMPDAWERMWTRRDFTTLRPYIDALDPTDMYEDLDNDGYDFDRDGEVDSCDDMIAPSSIDIAHSSEYTPCDLDYVLGVGALNVGTTVVVRGVYLLDDGVYAPGATVPIDRDVEVLVANDVTAPRTKWVTVRLMAHCNRPVLLEQYAPQLGPESRDRCRVDVQGVLAVEDGHPIILVRGHERFTNIMEYMAATYRGDNRVPAAGRNGSLYAWVDPTDPDTDDDGMKDGWEAFHGRYHVDPSTGLLVWDVPIDPTSGADAFVDLDGDLVTIRYTWVGWMWTDPSGDILPQPDGNGSEDPVSVGYNIHEFIKGTDPISNDTDRDSYPTGSGNMNDFDEVVYSATNPLRADTDGDGMPDGWELYFCLQANNASDMNHDEDDDGLVNHLEYAHGTHPRDPDTDGDIMADGWEVQYGLDPKDPRDAEYDIDVVRASFNRPEPDGLLNWQEFLNGSSPLDFDTDGDCLSDYEEVVEGFYVTVDGVAQHYFTDPASADTDHDDGSSTGNSFPWSIDDEDGDGNSDPNEEILDGIDNDGDSTRMQSDGIDNDHDGVVDDGRAGIPALGLPEGVDEEVDLNDWNEVFVFQSNASNPDSDLDGLDDWVEWFTDRDMDTQGTQRTSPVLSDTDDDGLTDKQEIKLNGVPWPWHPSIRPTDPLRPDSDDDGLSDGLELLFDHTPETPMTNWTDPWNPDTDGDGLLDGDEFMWADHDRDGLPTWWERAFLATMPGAELSRDADGSLTADILEDQDGDGLTCLEEYMWRCDPFRWDTDGDGIPDGADVRAVPWHLRPVRRLPVYSDTDGDLMPDWWELLVGLDPDDPNDKWADPDRDRLVNVDEYIYDLCPFNPDTDGDGASDLFDHEMMSSPDAYDSDGDGIANWWEMLYGMDPTDHRDADGNLDCDNWTNYEEWVNPADPWNWTPTNPLMTSTDGDYLADDNDPFPVMVYTNRQPLNPTRGVGALDPLRNITIDGKRQDAQDMDQDGLTNGEELLGTVWRTDPADPDTDLDGMPDGWEVRMATWDPNTAKPNLSPLDPGDALLDPDWDGVNWTMCKDDHGNYIIAQRDCNLDGWLDRTLENESFCNLEEYIFGLDLDRDGINELTPHPNRWDTDEDGISDGWEALLNDHDGDLMSNWYELLYGLDPFGTEGETGPKGDLDGDGATNLEEFWNGTSPRERD